MRGRDRFALGAPHDGARDVERRRDPVLARQHELGRRLVQLGDLVDDRLQRRDHLGGDELDARAQPVSVLRGGGELGAHDEQLALEAEQDLLELPAALCLGARQPEHGAGLVDRAVGIGPGRVLADASAVEEARGAIVTGTRIDATRHVTITGRRSDVIRAGVYDRSCAQLASDRTFGTLGAMSAVPEPTPAQPSPAPSPEPSFGRALLRTARPKQWTKNVLVFAAPAAAGVLDQGGALLRT